MSAYQPYRDEHQISINIPWDENTAIGFFVSMVLAMILLFILSFVHYDNPVREQQMLQVNKIPLDVISFGKGDGTGASHGNLTEEGIAHKGQSPASNLDDAVIAAPHIKSATNIKDPELTSKLTPSNTVGSSNAKSTSMSGEGSKNVGKPNGSESGTGLGKTGTGKGAGYGLGDIDWGGGGNRIVLQKRIPTYPKGANTSGQIKIWFVVDSKGTVINMRPALKGGDPVLERAAMNALRYWRFNPLKDDKDMQGIITFTFRLS